jgi:GNAT superfamily N-acetyltransferase
VDDSGVFTVEPAAPSLVLADTADGLLRRLPDWFGIPEANAEYVESARRLPGLVAHAREQPVGILLHRRHFAQAAEVHLMAVDPAWHRRGVGRALVDAVATQLGADGVQVLHVKTLGPAHPDPGYAGTRAFYEAAGFLPLEETHDLWPGTPCLLMARWLPGTP